MARTVKVRLGINGHASAMIVSRHMTTIQTGTITIYDVPDNISNYDLILLINKQVEGVAVINSRNLRGRFSRNHMTKHLILVAGNIGAGKTSLTERIGARLGWRTGYESVADNPYLADFYKDMRQWAFHLQIFFLGHRAEQHLALSQDPQSAILDRSIYEDAHIFARALYHMDNLTARDYHAYRTIFDKVINGLPRPDLLLYLKAPVPVLMERIRRRGRDMEGGISADYLTLLDTFYDEWLDTFDLCPVLTIHTDDLDFVHQPPHLDIVVQRIQDRLMGREDVIFPNVVSR